MTYLFYISAAVAVVSTLLVVTRTHAVHALLYLVVSLLSLGVIFFVLGAPFVAALEVIIYAGAIMVLFVFVIMMLNLGAQAAEHEQQLFEPGVWIGPSILCAVLVVELLYLLTSARQPVSAAPIAPKLVGIALFGPYVIGVELASMLLLAGLVGAYHLGRPHKH
ncbi:MAG TPA: NADH-quinone oxidoreductase subunit J [Nitrospirota bacterium]|nr:NADH-quinone oxidoreductase subunit J [Nitrospirota bacterium]